MSCESCLKTKITPRGPYQCKSAERHRRRNCRADWGLAAHSHHCRSAHRPSRAAHSCSWRSARAADQSASPCKTPLQPTTNHQQPQQHRHKTITNSAANPIITCYVALFDMRFALGASATSDREESSYGHRRASSGKRQRRHQSVHNTPSSCRQFACSPHCNSAGSIDLPRNRALQPSANMNQRLRRADRPARMLAPLQLTLLTPRPRLSGTTHDMATIPTNHNESDRMQN